MGKLRKSSRWTKKGTLEKIYREKTIPEIVWRSGGKCVLCGRPSSSGHHIFGRKIDYLHIHPAFVVPVCSQCHWDEKGLSPYKSWLFRRRAVAKAIEIWGESGFSEFEKCVVEWNWVPTVEIEKKLKTWVLDQLVEIGFWREK